MKGLELAEACFEEYGRALLEEHFPGDEDRVAAGLVGEGSQCFGFDDELSRDHDWGPGFCLWLTADDYARFGERLQSRYDRLPVSYRGFERAVEGPHAGKRTGVFEIKDFYRRFVRFDHAPATLAEWRALPEAYLATATNGKVFTDPVGEFTAFRAGLLAFYPEDLRLKKLAARCAAAGQSGQYNYKRCADRREVVAAHCALSTFAEAVISAIYLLNKRYKPFYKWMHRGLKDLPVLGAETYPLLSALCADSAAGGPGTSAERAQLVERISALVIAQLRSEGMSDSESDFLMDHGWSVQERIENAALRSLHVMME